MTSDKIDKAVDNFIGKLNSNPETPTYIYKEDYENIKEFKKQILELIVEARDETAKAYGGCTKCYGKGYATVRKGRSYRKNGIYKTWEMNEEMNFCTCNRGKQLSQHSKKRELEIRRDQINKDLGGQSFHMPIKSARNRNTAFKLYAIKFFNGTIKKRREQQLDKLTNGEGDKK